MDLLEQYRATIMEKLRAFATLQYPYVEITNKTVFDRDADRYLVMSEGWERKVRRIHGCLIDVEILNGKIWIQRDGTEYGFANDLIEAGIPKEMIVLGFKDEEVRPYTGFAIA